MLGGLAEEEENKQELQDPAHPGSGDFDRLAWCMLQVARQVMHRPQALRPHLAAVRRAAKPFRLAKLPPNGCHSPGVATQTAYVAKP